MKRVLNFQLKIRKNGALMNGRTKKLIMADPARSSSSSGINSSSSSSSSSSGSSNGGSVVAGVISNGSGGGCGISNNIS